MLLHVNKAWTVRTPWALLGKKFLTISPSCFISRRSRPPLEGALRPHRPSLVVTPVQDWIVLIHRLFLTSYRLVFSFSCRATMYGLSVTEMMFVTSLTEVSGLSGIFWHISPVSEW